MELKNAVCISLITGLGFIMIGWASGWLFLISLFSSDSEQELIRLLWVSVGVDAADGDARLLGDGVRLFLDGKLRSTDPNGMADDRTKAGNSGFISNGDCWR